MSNNAGDASDEPIEQNQGEGPAAEVGGAPSDALEPVDGVEGDAIAEIDDDAEADVSGAAAVNRRRLVREKAKRVSTKQRASRVVLWVVVVLVVLALVGAAALWIYRNVVPEVTTPAPEPGNVVEGSISFDGKDLSSMLGEATGDETSGDEATGDADSSVSVDVYVDYLSPESGLFHQSNAAQLAGWVQDGAISLTYHPVALLTAKSNGTKYAERAMGAVACVASGDPDHVVDYNNLLLTEQPDLDEPGYTSAELADMATSVGVENADVTTCITNDKYAEWARNTTNELTEGGLPGQDGQELTGVPLVLVGGVPYTGALDDPAELSQFVLTVESDEYYQSPSPEPSE